MKIMIASDIHGSYYYCQLLMEAFHKDKADKLLLLGDILYHGPRNDLPREYAPKEVIALLNGIKDRVYGVRGNCDTEVDQMVLTFPIMGDYALLFAGRRTIFATHGHTYHEKVLPPLQKGDILLHGHTHVPQCTEHENYIYMNPGSVSLPKENSSHSYMILEDDSFVWKNLLDGTDYMDFHKEY